MPSCRIFLYLTESTKTMNDFLPLEINNEIRKNVSKTLSIIQKILSKTKQKEKTRKANFFFTFVKNFPQQGVQGIVGVVLLKKILKPNTNVTCANIDRCASSGSTTMSIYFEDITKYETIQPLLKTHEYKNIETNQSEFHRGLPLVFKIAVDISNMILHEKNIAQHISQLNDFCPHFVNLLGHLEIPIASGFVEQFAEDSDDEEDCDCDSCQKTNDSESEMCDCDNCQNPNCDNKNTNSESENETNEEERNESESEEEEEEDEDENESDNEEEEEDENKSDNEEENLSEEEIAEMEKEQQKCQDLFYDTKESFPRTILFYEKINNFPLHRLLKKSKFDNNILSSQLLQVLMGLEIAQSKLQFTHYDLHTANILEQRCEFDAVFLYNVNNKKWLIPTFGYYPQIIDLGSSFSSVVNQHPMLTHANSYDYGFQSQIFDKLNDVHHSLMSLFYYMEDKKSVFDTLFNKFKYIFHRIPVLTKSGWKQLPHDLTDTVLWKIKKDCLPEYETYEIFREFKASFIENMNALITLPFDSDIDEEFKVFNVDNVDELDKFMSEHPKLNFRHCFHPVMEQINKMFADENICGEEILFVLREFFHIVYKHKSEIQKQRQIIDKLNSTNSEQNPSTTTATTSTTTSTTTSITTSITTSTTTATNKTKKGKTVAPPKSEHEKQKENAIKQLNKLYTQVKHELSEKTSYYTSLLVNFDVEFSLLIDGVIDASKRIQTIYYLLAKRHSQLISKCYERTIPNSPIDIFLYIAQNFTPNFYLNSDTIVYYWDIDNKSHHRFENCFTNESDETKLNKINSMPFLQKADAVFNLIHNKL